jgi:peptide methionine sulfoxide reductase MsrA
MSKGFFLLVVGVATMSNEELEGNNNKSEIGTFASGCFLCMESTFEELNGVVEVISGYTDSKEATPTYQDNVQKAKAFIRR